MRDSLFQGLKPARISLHEFLKITKPSSYHKNISLHIVYYMIAVSKYLNYGIINCRTSKSALRSMKVGGLRTVYIGALRAPEIR